MATMDPIARYRPVDTYWQVVRRTLSEVFGQTDSRDMEKLRHQVEGSPPAERTMFYHAEPLDVAADLAEQRPTPEQVRQYLNIAKNCKWELRP